MRKTRVDRIRCKRHDVISKHTDVFNNENNADRVFIVAERIIYYECEIQWSFAEVRRKRGAVQI